MGLSDGIEAGGSRAVAPVGRLSGHGSGHRDPAVPWSPFSIQRCTTVTALRGRLPMAEVQVGGKPGDLVSALPGGGTVTILTSCPSSSGSQRLYVLEQQRSVKTAQLSEDSKECQEQLQERQILQV